MSKRIKLDCTFSNSYDAWVVEVRDSVENELEVLDYLDIDFEEGIEKLTKKYKKLGYKVDVDISEGE